MNERSRFVDKKFSKEWANKQLKYALSVLKKEQVVCEDKGRIQIALIIKKDLMIHGFWWQSKVLGFHIHQFQKDQREVVVGLRRITR